MLHTYSFSLNAVQRCARACYRGFTCFYAVTFDAASCDLPVDNLRDDPFCSHTCTRVHAHSLSFRRTRTLTFSVNGSHSLRALTKCSRVMYQYTNAFAGFTYARTGARRLCVCACVYELLSEIAVAEQDDIETPIRISILAFSRSFGKYASRTMHFINEIHALNMIIMLLIIYTW